MVSMRSEDLPEEAYEKICRNISIACNDKAISFYENDDWIEISFYPRGSGAIGYCLSLVSKNSNAKDRFSRLFKHFICKCQLGIGCNANKPDFFKNRRIYSINDVCLEEMLLNIDMNVTKTCLSLQA